MKVGTEREWREARRALLVAERELEERAKRVEAQRRELPWVPVEKEYAFATEEGPKTLPELFEGRSRLLIYHFMFGEDWETACPGCATVPDGLSGVIAQMKDQAWAAMTGPQGQPYLRMFSPLNDTAGEPLWPGFRRVATTDWLAPLEDGMRSLGRPQLATVVLAVIRGLLMDLDATGDTARTHQAFHDFLTTIGSA
jgi:hypothetical protein